MIHPTVCGAVQANDAAAAAWHAAHQLQDALSSRASISSAPVALRMAGIKMGEQAALLYTSQQAQQLPAHAVQLARAAEACLSQLGQVLAVGSVRQQPGPVVVSAVRALGMVAQHRPQLLASVLPSLLALADQVRRLAGRTAAK